jgi:DNA-binding NarL/FixJ family response regulator
MKEVQVVVEKILKKLCATDRKMAAKLIEEHKMTWISDEVMKQD